MPIGEADANIFNCPSCARPLGVGVRRCPGCATRLIGGIKATRAVSLVSIGMLVGILVGGSLMAVVSAGARVTQGAAAVPQPSSASASQLPVASAAPPIVDPGVPKSALSALRQSVTLNQRVLVDADRLRAALGASSPTGHAIAPIMRNLASTVDFGRGVAVGVAVWDDGAAVSASLVKLYDKIGTIAESGLSASIGNSKAYVTSATKMLKAVAGVTAIDAASRKLALSAGVELPPLDTDSATSP
jgi:hypothetical protein